MYVLERTELFEISEQAIHKAWSCKGIGLRHTVDILL